MSKRKLEELTTLEWCIIGNTAFAAILVMVCIIIPPPGVVDDSVRECLWALLAFNGVLAIVFAVHKGIDAKFEKGDMSLSLNNPDPANDKDETH